MPILVDGSNLAHALGLDSPRREEVRRRVLARVREQRTQVTVVFDGPPPTGSPPRESLGSVTVIWAAPSSADDVIVRSLPEGTAARNWTVITDDRGLAARVTSRGAQVRRLADWHLPLPGPRGGAGSDRLGPEEIADWESWFARRERHDDR